MSSIDCRVAAPLRSARGHSETWKTHIQPTDAEVAFRVQKSELQIRPVLPHREDRVQAHILGCFPASDPDDQVGGAGVA